MTGLLFEHPGSLPWLAGAFTLLGLAVALARKRARGRVHALLAQPGSGTARRSFDGTLSDVLLLLAFAAISVALLGPRIGERHVSLTRGGGDVVLLLDVSASMRARDVPPSRFERARHLATLLLDTLPRTDRVALAGFAGRGVLFTPLTQDHDALKEMLAAFDTRLIQPSGSDLEAGIVAALGAFEPGTGRPGTIVVLSDGEQSEVSDVDAVTRSARAQVRIVGVALGTEAGTTVPDSGAPLTDRDGEVVTSTRRTHFLEKLSRATRGGLLIADRWGELPQGALVREIARDPWAEPSSNGAATVVRRVPAEAPLPFAALAFALLAAELLLAARRRAPPRGRQPSVRRPLRRARLAAGGAVALLALGAEVDFEATLEHLAEGWRAAESNAPQRAIRAYRAATRKGTDPRLAAIAEHNLGVLAREGGALAPARDHFAASLARHAEAMASCLDGKAEACPYTSDDRTRASETRFNLAWVRDRIDDTEQTGGGTPTPSGDSSEGDRTDDATRNAPTEDDAQRHATQSVPRSAIEPPPSLSAAEQRAWMARVDDDPAAALRRTAHEAPGPRSPRRGRVAW